MQALKEKDGYIFSKSVKTLSEKEKVWVLLPNDYREVKNSSGDVLYKIKECIDDFEYEIDDEKTVICYLAVFLTRLLQFKVLGNRFCSEDIFNFIRDFRVAKISDRKYMNLARNSNFIKELSAKTNLPLTSYFLSIGQIKKMLSHRF